MLRIPWSMPLIEECDRLSMIDVIKGDWYSEGAITEKFEKELCNYIGCKNAIVMNNGTCSLIAALWSFKDSEYSKVVSPSYGFITGMNVPIALGYDVILKDVDEKTLNMKKGDIEEKIDIIMPIDVGGLPVDLKNEVRANIIEDAAEAIGSERYGVKVGNSYHPTIFSFHIAKTMTMVEGGAVCTNNTELANKIRMFKNHGAMTKTDKTNFHSSGLNFRTTEIQAALGLSQLNKMPRMLKNREAIAKIYREGLEGLVDFQKIPKGMKTSNMFFPIFVDAKKRDRINEYLRGSGVETRICWKPMYQQPWVAKTKWADLSHKASERIYSRIICIPMGSGNTEEQAKEVVEQVKIAIKEC